MTASNPIGNPVLHGHSMSVSTQSILCVLCSAPYGRQCLVGLDVHLMSKVPN